MSMSYSDEIRFYLRIARRRLPYFFVPLLVIGAIGTAVVMKLPAIYSSSAKILVESQQIPSDFVKSTVTALASERLQVIQQRVLTRENLLEIAAKFNLFQDDKTLTRSDVVDLMKTRTTIQMLDLAGPPRGRNARSDNLTVVFSVGFEHERPDVAAQVANELVTIILNEDIQGRATRASETTTFLNRETERLTNELTAVDAKIAEFKLKNSETLPEKLQFNMSQLDRQEAQIAQIERDLKSAADAKRMLQFEASVRASMPPTTTQGPQTPEQEVAALQAEYDKGLLVYSANHPNMRSMKRVLDAKKKALEKQQAQIASVKTDAAGAQAQPLSLEVRVLNEKIATIDSQIELLTKQRENLLVSNDSLQKIILVTPQVGAELAALDRQREALQRSIDQMSDKLSQAKLGERMEENQQAERFEVIEAPIVAQEPVRPKRLPLIALVAAASLFSGIAAAGGMEFLDGTVKRSSDVTQKYNMRLLTVIPVIQNRGDYRRRRTTISVVLVGMVLFLLVMLVAVHFLYQPLDILLLRAMNALSRAL